MDTIGVSMVDQTQVDEFVQIIRSVFRLTKKEAECFLKLRRYGPEGTCVQNLVIQTESERSVEQKKLKKLLHLQLVTREALSLTDFQNRCSENNRNDLIPNTKKGYLYIYRVIPDSELIAKIKDITNQWLKNINNFLLPLTEN